MARRLDATDKDFAADFQKLLFATREDEEDVALVVKTIIADVRGRGDAALVELSNKFDRAGVTLESLKLQDSEIEAALAKVSKAQMGAIDTAARRIESYHRRQLPADERFTDETGAVLGWRWTSVDSVGLYVPGGTASYPSSVLMNAIPAHVAGVKRIVMVTPASGGSISPLVLAAARRAGITEIYRIGRRWRRWPMAPKALRRWTRSSAPETPMSPPPSAKCSVTWGSIPLPGLPRFWWWLTARMIRNGLPPIFSARPNMMPRRKAS